LEAKLGSLTAAMDEDRVREIAGKAALVVATQLAKKHSEDGEANIMLH